MSDTCTCSKDKEGLGAYGQFLSKHAMSCPMFGDLPVERISPDTHLAGVEERLEEQYENLLVEVDDYDTTGHPVSHQELSWEKVKSLISQQLTLQDQQWRERIEQLRLKELEHTLNCGMYSQRTVLKSCDCGAIQYNHAVWTLAEKLDALLEGSKE